MKPCRWVTALLAALALAPTLAEANGHEHVSGGGLERDPGRQHSVAYVLPKLRGPHRDYWAPLQVHLKKAPEISNCADVVYMPLGSGAKRIPLRFSLQSASATPAASQLETGVAPIADPTSESDLVLLVDEADAAQLDGFLRGLSSDLRAKVEEGVDPMQERRSVHTFVKHPASPHPCLVIEVTGTRPTLRK